MVPMAHVLDFDKVSVLRGRKDEHQAPPYLGVAEQRSDDFWPEVSCGLWLKQPADPANAPRRVLGEIALIIGWSRPMWRTASSGSSARRT